MPLPQGKLLANEEVQANVSSRVERAMADLALKAEQQRQAREQREEEERLKKEQEEEEAEIERIRQERLRRMMQGKEQEEKNRALGYGELGHINESEFLNVVTTCERTVVHFFKREYETCQVVNARLQTLASSHLETRFVNIDAEKAPFFVDRLKVRVLPAVLCFENGKYIGRVVGFNGENEIEQIRDLEKSLVMIGIIKDPSLNEFNKAKKNAMEDDEDEVMEYQKPGISGRTLTTSHKDRDDDW